MTVPERLLPHDDAERASLHNEVHTRPSARFALPAMVLLVAVLNRNVTREQEHAHLSRLPGQQDLTMDAMQGQFLRMRVGEHTVKWERHTEYTRYSIVQPLPAAMGLGSTQPDLLGVQGLPPEWIRSIPGPVVAGVLLAMVVDDLDRPQDELMREAQAWFGGEHVVASQMGNGHSWAVTDFQLREDGFERMLVLAPPTMSQSRAGRVSQRILELEIYRLMALRGLPVAKALTPMLTAAERELAEITAGLENKSASEQDLLDRLIGLAARVERATAEHAYRFSATRAYDALVAQRIGELREKAIPGTQTIGEFMQRRLSPAMATVHSTAQRMASLSERIARTSDLLRTRVDIATEVQNHQLLEKLTRGQALQLQLQTMVEGLSIAAISYYVVSLLLYVAKALKGVGLPVNPELAAGALIPVVMWGVWKATRRIHAKLHDGPGAGQH